METCEFVFKVLRIYRLIPFHLFKTFSRLSLVLYFWYDCLDLTLSCAISEKNKKYYYYSCILLCILVFYLNNIYASVFIMTYRVSVKIQTPIFKTNLLNSWLKQPVGPYYFATLNKRASQTFFVKVLIFSFELISTIRATIAIKLSSLFIGRS